MNTPLIRVTPGYLDGRQAQLVDARLPHAFLNVGRDFSNWIKGRISESGFTENQDYLLAKVGEQLSSGNKWRIDYLLSLHMAKELAMVERTATRGHGLHARGDAVGAMPRSGRAPPGVHACQHGALAHRGHAAGCVHQDRTASSREGTGSGGGHAQWWCGARWQSAHHQHNDREQPHGPAAVDL
jgi:phage anti-repressor protein